MKPKIFKLYSDAGHGWLAVKRKDIPLEILAKISSCSYQRGATVYLEEDCDALAFIRYLDSNSIGFKYSVGLVEKITNERSPIRSYERFQLTQSELLLLALPCAEEFIARDLLRVVKVGA